MSNLLRSVLLLCSLLVLTVNATPLPDEASGLENLPETEQSTLSTAGVLIKPASHGANEYGQFSKISSATDLFQHSCEKEYSSYFKSMMQSSFSNLGRETADANITAAANGFVMAAIDAYANHHHLILRPEDIWFSILSQLNFYINKNAEELRDLFVDFEGKKSLTVEAPSYDFGMFAESMTHLIAKNIKDPGLREWIVPKFSTTTETDIVVASILMMGAMQKYFEYIFMITCGIPSVKLLGTREDWEEILKRLDYLPSLGKQAGQFGMLLEPVIKGFIRSFDQPDSQETKDFWNKIAYHEVEGCGIDYLSGWITAFCFWDSEGKQHYRVSDTYDPEEWPGALILEGVLYYSIESGDIPQGYVSVPVTINDNGHEYKSRMAAGSVAINVTSSGENMENGLIGLDTLQPVSGWWIFEAEETARGDANALESASDVDYAGLD